MAGSISKAQADLLASKKLDTHGSANETPAFELSATEQALVNVAGILANAAADNLHNAGHIGTGALASSIQPNLPQVAGSSIKVDVMALDYFDYMNSGVKGVKGGNGKYGFKYARPSSKMVKAIQDWIANGHITSTRTNAAKTPYKGEQKNKSISQLSAYAVAQSIINKGLKATGFMDKAIQTASDAAEEQVSSGLVVDIISSIPNTLG